MNCRRVEKLLPLFVEDDLRPALATRIASHLEWCGKCNWLADDYRESQSWLRASTPPEFDNALLDSVKNGALAQIAASNQRPSRWAALALYLNRRQVFALSAAALVIVATFVIYGYQTRLKDAGRIESVKKVPDQTPPVDRRPDLSSAPKTALEASSPPPPSVPKRTRHSLKGFARAGVPREREKLDVAQFQAPILPDAQSPNLASESKDMLRIEIQTSDPLIRIIWFAPRESDSPPTKPATD
ncbi:MAG TPA: zf-HC2 domain-containing protein [Blastocatellia bacterium]|nr:zf-HC2 domain-containing protein [Blastocatellia bacterium]